MVEAEGTDPVSPKSGARLPDPYTPGHGTAAYRVRRYDLDLDVRLASNRLSGQARIRAEAREKLDTVSLSLAGLRVTKVFVDGAKPAKSAQRGDQLVVTPRNRIPKGRAFDLEIRYEGSPRPIDGRWGEVGWEELDDGVLVAGQPVGAPTWFPCNDHPSQKAAFRIAVTADAGYRVVSNGVLTSRRTRSSRETWVYDQPEPMSPYLATVLIGRYRDLELGRLPDRGSGRVRVLAAVPPELRAEAATGLKDQVRMVKLFSELFGPYPFRDYTVVVTEDELEIPLEAQSLSIVGRNHIKRTWEAQRLLAHELAHQWFGNSVTVRCWADIWLHEGFACYAEWLWSEEAGIAPVKERAAAAWKLLATKPQDLLIGVPGPDHMFDDRVYKRGALALHAVRRAVGDDRFFRSLRAFASEYRHGLASTADFVEILDRVCAGARKFDAAAVLRPWLYQRALPAPPK
ncbi:M1 family metallopeptidase [Sinomonas sp. ASV322]|uniref:M1 family metallopeptidase n=1 Tax=Sinomonas sp. ASV322 TaxID=3041920 RepID=UPI0027DC692C|nr:M1 family metallopeptidase [Sinomonas sp. ASV322]MDQ4502642.1 M1 family metallopeptidase [Sinomonas sp. ASV322]